MKKLFLFILLCFLAGAVPLRAADTEQITDAAGNPVPTGVDVHKRDYLASRLVTLRTPLKVKCLSGGYACSDAVSPIMADAMTRLQTAFNQWISVANQQLDPKNQIRPVTVVKVKEGVPDLIVDLKYPDIWLIFNEGSPSARGGLSYDNKTGILELRYPYEWKAYLSKLAGEEQRGPNGQLLPIDKTEEELLTRYKDNIALFYGSRNYKELENDNPKLFKTLEAHEDWVNQLPSVFDITYQHIVSHELGHVLGLGHTDAASSSIMHARFELEGPAIADDFPVLGETDGANLAALYCYYANRNAVKRGQKPVFKMLETAKRQEETQTVKREMKASAQDLAAQLSAQRAALQVPSSAGAAGPLKNPLGSPAESPVSAPQVRADAVPATAVAPASVASASSSAALLKAEQKRELDSFLAQNRVSLKQAVQKKNIGAPLSAQEAALLSRYGALYQNFAQKAPSVSEQQTKEIPVSAAAPAAPAKVYCSVCGQEITNASDAYQATANRAVHKHARCAYQYFSRRYSVDAKSLDDYEAFHFFGAPAGVTAAKGLMKDLGLTPADVRRYANVSRQEAARQREEMAQAKKEREEKARAENETPALYQTVTDADVQNFIRANSQTLNALRRKQKEGQTLSQKERLVWQNYQQLIQNRKLTQTYQSK